MRPEDKRSETVPLRDWVYVSDVAQAWGVDKAQVRSWCRSQSIRAVREPGGQWRIHPDEVRPR